jgi:hypothetical protein
LVLGPEPDDLIAESVLGERLGAHDCLECKAGKLRCGGAG